MASKNSVKALRIFFGVIIALLVLLFVAAYSAGWYVKKHLPEWVLKASDSVYQVTVTDVSVNLFTGKITAENFDMQPDTSRLVLLSKNGHSQKVAITLHIPKLQIDGFACMRLARKHELSCDDILLWQPRVLIKPVPVTAKQVEEQKKEAAIKGIFINKVIIMQPDVTYRAKDEDDDSLICHLYGGKAELDELQLIPGHSDTNRILLSKNCIIDSSAFSFDKKKALYTVRVPAFFVNTGKDQLLLQGFSIHPTVNHQEFYRILGHRMTICDIYVASAALTGLDWQRLLHDHHEISTAKLRLISPVINLYFDYTQPSHKGDVTDKDPHNILRNLSVKLNVQDIAIENGHVAYTELSEESKREGTILFERISGFAKNITNVKSAIAHDGVCTVSLKGTFMHKSDMSAMLSMSLSDSLGGYVLDGHIKNGDAAEINEVARNLALIQVDSLTLDRLDAHLQGDQTYVNGSLGVVYSNLKAELMKSVPVNDLKSKKFVSFIANTFFVYHDNPMPGKKERTATTNQPRDPEVPFFGTLVKNVKHNGRRIVVKDEPIVDVVTGDTKDLPPLPGKKKGFFRRLFQKKK